MELVRHGWLRWVPILWLGAGLILALFLWPKAFSKSQESTQLFAPSLADFKLPPLPAALAPIPKIQKSAPNPNILAHSAILVDDASGLILYSDRAQASIPIASTTKLMTALVVRSRLDLDSVIKITQGQTTVIGSDMGLQSGETITARSLLTGLLIVSGNDAAIALAETVAGSVDQFVALMNAKATSLGLKQTVYHDPAGLDDEGRSTAFELSVIARAALKDPVIAEIVRQNEAVVTSVDGRIRHDLKNSNRLVGDYQYPGALGLKTGFTPAAGHCLVAAAQRDNHRLIVVILRTDAETITASADEARKLLEWGWQNVTWS